MPRRRPLKTGFATALAFLGIGTAPAHAQFQFGFQDAGFDPGSSASQVATAFEAVQVVGGSFVRITLPWAAVAPSGSGAPAGFQPSNPLDSHYRWSAIDAQVRSAAQHHLNVVVVIANAPTWAQGPGRHSRYVSPGGWNPNRAQFAAFVHAAAVRYGGGFPDPLNGGATLPRVRYWEPWNEPNIPGFFSAPNPVARTGRS